MEKFGEKIFRKKSHNAEKNWKGGPFGIFQHPFCRKTSKIKGGNFFSEKSLTVPKKTERGDSLVCPDMVCYAEKEEKPFWFGLLGQMYQFGTIKFCRTCRTILVGSCGLKKKSHYNSRVSLHEAPTKNDSLINDLIRLPLKTSNSNSVSKFLLSYLAKNATCMVHVCCMECVPCLWCVDKCLWSSEWSCPCLAACRQQHACAWMCPLTRSVLGVPGSRTACRCHIWHGALPLFGWL